MECNCGSSNELLHLTATTPKKLNLTINFEIPSGGQDIVSVLQKIKEAIPEGKVTGMNIYKGDDTWV
jgi:hypothetical protein